MTLRRKRAATTLLLAALVCVGSVVLANTPPVAQFVASASSDGSALTVLFNATESYDSDGAIVSYQWVFGDGYSGSGITKVHTYPGAGDYDATLLVIDNEGAAQLVTRTIDPSNPGVPKPIASQAPATHSWSTSAPIGNTVGKAAPSFTLSDLSGTQVSLSDFLGQVVILDFWRSTCPACQALMPTLEDVRQRNQNRGLVVVGINLDANAVIAARYLQQSGYSDFVTLWGANSAVKEVENLYGVTGLPRVFLVDRQGVIRFSGLSSQFGEEDIEPWL
jgi:thiol-disulfide isomerase/thioredoxin